MPAKPPSLHHSEKPLAAAGLISYRCKGPFGYIMIGATSDDDALSQARHSSPQVQAGALERWDGVRYSPVEMPAEVRGEANDARPSAPRSLFTGFQITEDDVAVVLQRHTILRALECGVTLDQVAEDLLDELNLAEIENMALMGDDMDQQTEYAHDEIAKQLARAGVIMLAGETSDQVCGALECPRPRG